MSERYWGTPPEIKAALDAEFGFDFDPFPHPRPEGFDAFSLSWGKSNWVNPPFGGPMAETVRRCAANPTSVLALPCFRERAIQQAHSLGAEIRWLGMIAWRELDTEAVGEARPMLIAIWRRPRGAK